MSSDRWVKFLWAIPLINIVYGVINIFQLGVFLPLIPIEDVLHACLFVLVAAFSFQKDKKILWIPFLAVLLALLHFFKSYIFWESLSKFDWYETFSPFIMLLLLIVLCIYWWEIQWNVATKIKFSWSVLLGWFTILFYFLLSVLLDFEYYHAVNYCWLSVLLLINHWKEPISIEKLAILLAALLFLTNKFTYIWL
jgi:hypothetical protein